LLAAIKKNDPAYTNAMELAETLRYRGVTVKCVLQSKMVGFFDGQMGAALYRTDRGDFEALFLQKPAAFAIRTVERQENGRYLFTFGGSPPQISSHPLDSNRPWYFAQHVNVFLMTDEKKLAIDLQKVLN
jgi:hypothetical protein